MVENKNNVILRFAEPSVKCYYMFAQLINIIEVDLSYFDFSSMLTLLY